MLYALILKVLYVVKTGKNCIEHNSFIVLRERSVLYPRAGGPSTPLFGLDSLASRKPAPPRGRVLVLEPKARPAGAE